MKRLALIVFFAFASAGFAQLNTSQCMDTLYRFSDSNGSVKGALVADWNNDAYTDVLLASYDAGTINVWYNSSTGSTLPSQLVIPDLPQARSITGGFFDLNGSADMAVLITNGGIDSVILLFNDGTGGIMNRIGFPAPGYQQIFVKDLNNDNIYDIVGYDASNVYVHMNQGPGPFAAVQTFSIPHANIRGLDFGDMDNDNKPDLFVASQFVNGTDSSQVLLIQNTTPAYQINPVLLAEVSRYTFTPGVHTGLNSIAVADLNGDNNDDVAASLGGSVEIATLLNTGANTLGTPDVDLLAVSPVLLSAAEMNNDGYTDLVGMNANGEVLFSHNDGTGHCVTHTVYNPGTPFYNGLATGYLDNAADTRTDVVIWSSLSGQVIPAAIYNRNYFSVSLGISTTTICGNDSALFTAAVSDPVYAAYSGFTDFLWSNGTVNDSAYFNTTQASLSAQFSNTLGCVRSATSALNVIPVPTTFNVTGPAAICDTLLVYLNPPMANLDCGWNAGYPFPDFWQVRPGSDSVYITTHYGVPTSTDYYTLTYTDTVSGCTGSIQLQVNLSGLSLYNQGLVATFCENDTISLYNYLSADDYFAPSSLVMNWVSQYNSYTGVHAQHYDPVHYVQTFTATVTDLLGCSLTDTLRTQVLGSAKDLIGHISSPASLDVTSGFVYAYKLDSTFTYSDTLARVSLDASGNYVFPLLDNGVFILKAEPDYATFPNLISTYYGGQPQWYFSQLVAHGCVQVDTADIQVLQADTATGTGSISGYLIEDVGFASGRFGNGGHDHICVPGGPLKGIDVKLGKNPAGGIQARAMTDSTGHYSFDNVPLQGYKIYVDIPNMLMDSTRELVLSAGNETSVQNNYYVDSTLIYINPDSISTVGIYASNKKYENHFSIYPNPAKGRINLRFRLDSLKEVELEITDAIGNNVYSITEKPIMKGENELGLDAQEIGLKAGVYFVSIVCEGRKSTQRVVVVE